MISFEVCNVLFKYDDIIKRRIYEKMRGTMVNCCSLSGLSSYFIENFVFIRTQSEQFAYTQFTTDTNQQITLKEIYDVISLTGEINDLEKENLIELEEQTFLSLVEFDKNNLKIIENSIEHEDVILIADTYYSVETIKQLFERARILLQDYRIYITSKNKKNKISTSLYQLIKYNENIEVEKWTHYGPDVNLDVNTPKLLGIHGIQIQTLSTQEKYEVFSDNSKQQELQKKVYSSLIDNTTDVVKKMGIKYGGPLFFSYVHWVLDNSLRRGIKRLYFIARDGYILKEISDIIIKKYNIPISTYYIYGSRRAWKMAGFSKSNCDLGRFIYGSGEDRIRSADALAKVFQIDTLEINTFIPNYYMDKEWSVEDYNSVRDIILNSNEFIDYLIIKHTNKRKLLKGYLMKSVDFSDKNYAFVEMSGSGLTQECLADVIQEISPSIVKTYFLKLDFASGNQVCENYSFYPGFIENGYILETLCHSVEGSTVGYEEKNGDLYPIIDDTETKFLSKYGCAKFNEGVIDYTIGIVDEIEFSEIEYLSQFNFLIESIVKFKDKELTAYIQDMPFDCSGTSGIMGVFAPKLTVNDIINIYGKRLKRREPAYLYNGIQLIDVDPVFKYYRGGCLELSKLRTDSAVWDKASAICDNLLKNKISVVVTTYNRKYEVGLAIETVLNQTKAPYEIIVIDDGSSDGTVDYLRNRFRNTDIIYIVNNYNKGAGISRNMGLKYASGMYIAYLDSDNEWYNNKLEVFDEKISNIEYDGCNVDLIYSSYKKHINFDTVIMPKRIDNIRDKDELYIHSICDASASIYKREFLVTIGGFSETMHTNLDWELLLRAQSICSLSIYKIDDVLSENHVMYDSLEENKIMELQDRIELIKKYHNDVCESISGEVNRLNQDQIDEMRQQFQSQINRKNSFYNLLYEWIENKQAKKFIATELLSRGVHSVAIYGAGKHGKLLMDDLYASEIEIKCFIDEHKQDKEVNGVKITNLKNFSERVDAIIVSTYLEFDEIQKKIRQMTDTKVISLFDIVHDINIKLKVK